jgi:7-carboxy-7-deazaguanine synthase
MFGHNQIVGVKFFKDAPKNELLVTSRFFTLQGEGPYRGVPAFFIRLAKCNLACSFCDTYFDSGEYYTYEQLFHAINSEIENFFLKQNMKVPEWAQGPKRKMVLVITGGEPSLQDNLPGFLELALREFEWTQIESNGIRVLENIPRTTTLVVSPKCLEKDGKAVKYLSPSSEMLDRADCLKFVMSVPESEQFNPYSEVPQWAHEWAKKTGKPVFVSPMNIYLQEPAKAKKLRAEKEQKDITIEERSTVDEVISFWEPGLLDMPANQKNHEYAALYCIKHGFILNLQIHLYASLP